MDTLRIADLSGLLLDKEWSNKEFSKNFLLKSYQYESISDLQEWDDNLRTFVPASARQRREAEEAMAQTLQAFRDIELPPSFIYESTVHHDFETEAITTEEYNIHLHYGNTMLNAVTNAHTCYETEVKCNWLSLSTARSFDRGWKADGTIFVDMELVRAMRNGSKTNLWNPDTQEFGDRGRSNVLDISSFANSFLYASIEDYIN